MLTLETRNVLGFNEQKESPAFIIRNKIDSKRLKTITGKSQWRRKGDASNALTHHLKVMCHAVRMEYFDGSLAQGRIVRVAANTDKAAGYYFLGAFGEVIRKDNIQEVKQYMLDNLVEIVENK